MGILTLEQAVRNAVEVERSAGRFYRTLADGTSDAAAKKFLQQLAGQEDVHAESIEKIGKQLVQGELPQRADDGVELIESAPDWRFLDNLSFGDALQVAREAESHAALYYDALADAVDGPVSEFFAKLARTEEQHVRDVEQMIQQLPRRR
jgi:rubrerythrin